MQQRLLEDAAKKTVGYLRTIGFACVFPPSWTLAKRNLDHGQRLRRTSAQAWLQNNVSEDVRRRFVNDWDCHRHKQRCGLDDQQVKGRVRQTLNLRSQRFCLGQSDASNVLQEYSRKTEHKMLNHGRKRVAFCLVSVPAGQLPRAVNNAGGNSRAPKRKLDWTTCGGAAPLTNVPLF